MISVLAARIAQALCTSAAIEECDKELYQYGFFILLSWIVFFFLAILVGLIFLVPLEGVVFYIMFSLLRSYSGGTHAKTEQACILLTSFVILVSIAIIFLMNAVQAVVTPIGMLLFGFISILKLSPLTTKEKLLSDVDQRHYRYISWAIYLGIIILSLMGIFLDYYGIFYCAAMAGFLDGSILLLGSLENT